MTDFEARYKALRELIISDRDAQHHEKVIHPFHGPSFQNWYVELSFADPLPENYDRSDLDRHRLTLEQAVDRWVEQAIKGGA